MFALHEQYIDAASGFHVVVLRDGKKEHILQIGIGHDSCPACGVVHPKSLDGVDPKQAVTSAISALDAQQAEMLEYAQKHGVKVR